MQVYDAQLDKVRDLIEPSIESMGFRLVQIRLMGAAMRPTLQIMAEPLDESRQMDVDDCAEISRAVSALLDVEDPIKSAYTLEVSSPGIDRPLVQLEDYRRFAGHEARIETRRLLDGRRRFTGRLRGERDGDVLIVEAVDGDGERETAVPFGEIAKAKLLLTDELIEATLKKRKH